MARYGVDRRQRTASPPTTITGRPVCCAMTGMAATIAAIAGPYKATDCNSLLPDTLPPPGRIPRGEGFAPTVRVLGEIERHEQRMG